MSLETEQPASDQVIRLSWWWLFVGTAAVLIVGLLGGVLAQQIFHPNLPPLTSTNGDKLVSTVQQVTISPNKAVDQMVQSAQRSVVLLGQVATDHKNWLGTGLVLTNDGVIVTSATMPDTGVLAFDATGQPIKLDKIGQDALFGLTYFRAPDAVLVPLDLSPADAGVGTTLVGLSRELNSLTPHAVPYTVSQYVVPADGVPVGIQKMLQGTVTIGDRLGGSPLLDDEGKVRGILLDPTSGMSLPVSQLETSLNRLTSNQRERNPLTELGVTLKPTFQNIPADQPLIFTEQIITVTPNSPAYQAGLQKGDVITKVNDQTLDWNQSVVAQLGAKLPLTMTFYRNGQPSTVTLQPVTSPTPNS